MSAYGQELKNAFYEMSRVAVNWEDILVQAMFALATREHVFWLSEPGRAKSWVSRMIFSLFPDAKTFVTQVTKDMMPSALFGSEVPKEYLEKGVEIFNLDGGVCTADLIYLDEFLDGPDFLVRSMNSVLNERLFERKDQKVVIPLHTGIMTTNFDRYGSALHAVRDRMMCKAVIDRVGGLVDRVAMYNAYLEYPGTLPPLPKLSFGDMKGFAAQVETPGVVAVPDEVRLLQAYMLDQYLKLRVEKTRERMKLAQPDRELSDADVLAQVEPVSPRTESKLNDFSRAAALLDNRQEVECADLRFLRYGLVTLNGDNVDDLTWQSVCDSIPSSQAQIGRLRSLAGVANSLAELKRQGTGGLTSVAIQIAGKVENYTRTTLLEYLERLSQGGTNAVVAIAQQLKSEIAEIGKPLPTTRLQLKGAA